MGSTTRNIPRIVPEVGFYYHYKHQDQNGVNDQAYEVLGTGLNTEVDDCRSEDAQMVIYRPLYEADIYTAGKLYNLRPLSMFLGNVIKDKKTIKRFTKITDEHVVAKLISIRDQMYGE